MDWFINLLLYIPVVQLIYYCPSLSLNYLISLPDYHLMICYSTRSLLFSSITLLAHCSTYPPFHSPTAFFTYCFIRLPLYYPPFYLVSPNLTYREAPIE